MNNYRVDNQNNLVHPDLINIYQQDNQYMMLI